MHRDRSRSPHGFRLICRNGTLDVQPKEEKILRQTSSYFDALFKHGTVESSTRVLIKKDWSLVVSTSVLKLLCGSAGALEVAFLPELCQALDHIVCLDDDIVVSPIPPLHGFSGLNSDDLVPLREYIRFSELGSSSSRWQLTPTRGVGMFRLLQHGIKLTDIGGLVYVARRKDIGSATHSGQGFAVILEGCKKNLTESIQTYFEIRHADGRLAACLKNKPRFHRPELSICISGLLFAQNFEQSIKRIAHQLRIRGHSQNQVRAKSELKEPGKDYRLRSSGNSNHAFFYGSPQQLHEVLTIIKQISIYSSNPRWCSLRMAAPSKQQLLDLVSVLQMSCDERRDDEDSVDVSDMDSVGVLGGPCTLGFDVDVNALYVIRGLVNMHTLLELLADVAAGKAKPLKPLGRLLHICELDS